MALTGTDRGSGNHNTSALSFTLSPASNFTAGALGVLCLSVDNSDSAGNAHSTFTVTDTLNNTWTRRLSPLYDPGNANTGVEGAIFTTPQDNGTLQTSTTITVTFDANCTAKVWTLMEVTGSVGTPVYKTGGVGTGSATASPTVTSSSIPINQMIIGAIFNEQGTGQTPTGDTDTTNGSWSTMQTDEVGSTAAGQTIITQRKVVTATGTQTYNPTLGTSSDVIAGWISIGEDITVSSGLGVLDLTGYSPAISVSNNILVSSLLGELTITGLSSSVIIDNIVYSNTGSLSIIGFEPTVDTGGGVMINTLLGELNLSAFSPTVSISDNILVSTNIGSLALDGFFPIINVTNHILVNTDLGSLLLTGFSPQIELPVIVNSQLGQLVITGYIPTISDGSGTTINTVTGELQLTGISPYISIHGAGGRLKRWNGSEWLLVR